MVMMIGAEQALNAHREDGDDGDDDGAEQALNAHRDDGDDGDDDGAERP